MEVRSRSALRVEVCSNSGSWFRGDVDVDITVLWSWKSSGQWLSMRLWGASYTCADYL